MPAAVCARCNAAMKVIRTGAPVLEKFEDGNPYKLWAADLLQCPICQIKVLMNFGTEPMASHYQLGFANLVLRTMGQEQLYEF